MPMKVNKYKGGEFAENPPGYTVKLCSLLSRMLGVWMPERR